jgi:hypothetical protein
LADCFPLLAEKHTVENVEIECQKDIEQSAIRVKTSDELLG